MLNTVNLFFVPLYLIFSTFVTGDCPPIILCSSFETLFSASMDDFKCSSVKEQNKHPFKEEKKRSPEAVFRR